MIASVHLHLAGSGRYPESITGALVQLSRQEVLSQIKDDYKKNYFVNGAGEMGAYEEDCLFTDPFSGFRGTKRFKTNVSNFGNFLEDVQLDVLDFREVDNGLRTRWRFGATLKFPWRPRLAASGRTTHIFSEVCQCSTACLPLL